MECKEKMECKGKIVQIIENDLNLQKNLKDFLEKEGVNVIAVSDGAQGILKAFNIVPDIIICDISIPIKNGYEVLEELSKNEKTNVIPFILFAPNIEVEKEDIRKALQLGAEDFIFKPFSFDDVLNSIKLRLQKSEIRTHSLTSKMIEKKYVPNDIIFVMNKDIVNIVKIKNIKFIKAETPYVIINCRDGKKMPIRGAISDWEEKLPDNMFLRINRSVIVNTDMITRIQRISLTSYLVRLIDEQETFIISKRYGIKIKNKILR